MSESLQSFNLSLSSRTVFEFFNGNNNFSTIGITLLAGVQEGDIVPMREFLKTFPKAKLVVPFDDFVRLYDAFMSAFKKANPSTQGRLLFVTNLPHWRSTMATNQGPAAALTASFLAAVPDANYQAPAAMRAYLASRVLQQLSSSVSTPTSSALKDALYEAQLLNVDGLPLGPFQLTNCSYTAALDSIRCDNFTNAGAAALYVWPFERVLHPGYDMLVGPYVATIDGDVGIRASPIPQSITTTTTTTSQEPTTTTTASTTTAAPTNDPGTTHDRDTASSSKTTTIVVAVTVCGCVLVLGVLAALLWLCCRGDSRDNRNAPKDDTQPVTLMFTDIESSTALWAMAPQAMAAAMAKHHSMIRELIVRYKCYEVKTIGDSFMIACADPFAAVQLARDAQLNFLNADWGATTIDDTYAALGKAGARASSSSEDRGGGDNSSGGAGPRVWSGLRARIGVHRGMAEVRLDEVTNGYDYCGDTVNTAARTESAGCGGQVLCTSSVVDALTAEQRDSVDFVVLGPYRLRGVTELVEMHELHVVDGRVFPSSAVDTSPLAALGDAGGDGDAAGTGNPMIDSDDSNGESSHASSNMEQVTEVLDVSFSAYSDRQKIKLLQRTCKYFSLPTPPRKAFASDAAYLRALVQSVAARTSVVIDFKHRLQEVNAMGSLLDVGSAGREEDCAGGAAAAAGLRQPSGVFFSGTATSPGGDANVDPSLAIGPRSRRATEETIVLALDNGELLTLNGGPDKPAKAAHYSAISSVPDEACLAAPEYLNGKPSVSGDKVSACFKEANGLLFRVVDTAAGRWAFYNDTTSFVMHVHFAIDQTSVVQWGPALAGKVNFVAATGRYEGELLVAPPATEVLLTGKVSDYGMRYSATLAGNDD